jgi:pimeloyl-ACP methyl ester carboxylesterase
MHPDRTTNDKMLTSAEGLDQKTTITKCGYRYTYYTSPAKDARPTVMLLHGFPDEAREWFDLAKNALIPAGYGVVIPDLLGYAGTDKPKTVTEYAFSAMSRDLVDVLDAEKLEKVVVIGHDWGAGMTNFFYYYAPERCTAIGLVNLAYLPPLMGGTSIAQVNDELEKLYGYRCYEYQNFFASDESDRLCLDKVDYLFDCFSADGCSDVYRYMMFKPNTLKLALEQRLEVKRKWHESVTQQDKQHFIQRFKRDGFNGPCNWYRYVIHHGLPYGDEPVKAGPLIEVPVLFIGYTDDLICRRENILAAQKDGFLPRLTNITLQGGHWGMVQDPEPFGHAVKAWLSDL